MADTEPVSEAAGAPKVDKPQAKSAIRNQARNRARINARESSSRPACGYHNHEGCRRKGSCLYRHTADTQSIVDSRGKNVCFHFITGTCKFDNGTCWYSHSLHNLAPSKKKATALARRRDAAGKQTDTDRLFECMRALKTSGKYEPDTQTFTIRTRQSDAGSITSGTSFEWSDDSDESEPNPLSPSSDDSDAELLLEQGIKPWDMEAAMALEVLRIY